MKTVFTLLASLLIFTQVMQAHPTGHDHSFLETISHLFTETSHSLWLATATVIGVATYCLRKVLAKN